MREILFRGKRKDNAGWVYGNFVRGCVNDFAYIVEFGNKELCRNYVEVIPSTMGQYIGLTDKNGKRIFEGDIIKHFNHFDKPDEYAIYKVEFDEKICKFSGRLNKQWSAQLTKDLEKRYEVIGNIHDNPELLKIAER